MSKTSKTDKTNKTGKREALRNAKVTLSRIKAQQGQLSLLERCELSGEERSSVEKMRGELRELKEEAEFLINLLREDKG